MEEKTTIIWFRDDLRLCDHPALDETSRSGSCLVCLFVLDSGSAPRPPGGAARWWLAGSLRALDEALGRLGQRLVLRRGPATEVVVDVARAAGAARVLWNRRHDPAGTAIDREVTAALAADGIAADTFRGDLLHEPEKLAAHGPPPRVFTPFWRRLRGLGAPPLPLPAPSSLPPPVDLASEALADWKLEPSKPDWAGGLRETWTPGEEGARECLAAFADGGLTGYAERRERADIEGTSRLSPHLRFGEVSPGTAFHAVNHALAAGSVGARVVDGEKFLTELGWRDFSRFQLRSFPDIATRNIRPDFDRFPWRDDAAGLRAWQRGETGYPLVDAAMRDLWATGFMPNRLRMVAASFLVKHLMIDWRLGEAWFWDTLVDADSGSNPANWQWVAGSGLDAAPYFRIFNPVLQGARADPEGAYVRRWVPELAQLPTTYIHAPWTASPLELASCGVVLGRTYPERLVEHAFARQRALDAFAAMRKG